MGKLITYVMITVGLMVLFNMSGLIPSSFYSIDNLINFQSLWFYVGVIGALALLVSVTGIRIGTFGMSTSSVGVAAGAAIPLVFFIGNLVSIINATGTLWIKYILFGIMSPVLFGYTLALFEWARGNDT